VCVAVSSSGDFRRFHPDVSWHVPDRTGHSDEEVLSGKLEKLAA